MIHPDKIAPPISPCLIGPRLKDVDRRGLEMLRNEWARGLEKLRNECRFYFWICQTCIWSVARWTLPEHMRTAAMFLWTLSMGGLFLCGYRRYKREFDR